MQLATSTKHKVTSYVKGCKILMNGFNRYDDLNILPLGSYDMLIGMDWLEKQRVMPNCFDKTFTCIEDTGNPIKVKGISIKVMIKEISTVQMKKYAQKGFKVIVFYLMDDNDNDNRIKIEGIPILKDFKDIFRKKSLYYLWKETYTLQSIWSQDVLT